MDRRGFIRSIFTASQRDGAPGLRTQQPQSSGLEPYIPTSEAPWNEIRAGHLLRRTTFLPRWQDVDAVMKMSPSDAVDLLLNTTSQPSRPSMADHETESLAGLDVVTANGIRSMWRNDAATLRLWLSDVWAKSGLSIYEKLTFFWHGHFTSEFENDLDFVIAPLLYRQNELLRNNCLANFKDLVFYITLDGAMLVYLGGNVNKKGRPNENYARELLELYTTGIGHYTEGDIKEAARILTGWKVGQYSDDFAPNGIFNPYFEPDDHDTQAKQFFGETFSARDASTNTEFLVRKEEVRKLIDTIFDYRGDAVARFICRKLYRFFVYSNPSKSDESVIYAMAQVFKDNNFEIKPVLSALLKSAHFFDNANIGAQIKTPAELMTGLVRQFDYNPATIPANMSSTDQIIFDPPNVSGWPGWHDWITTNNYPVRATIATAAVNAMTQAKLITFIKQFPNYDDVDKLCDHLGAMLLPRPLSFERKEAFVKILTNNGPGAYVWTQAINNSPADAAGYMKNLLQTIIQLPDFQLC